jgi:flagellar biosynthesis protein FlhA
MVILLFFGLMPGLPMFPFVTLSLILGAIAFSVSDSQKKQAIKKQEQEAQVAASAKEVKIENLLEVDTVSLEIGYGLISIVDESANGDLVDRITSIRKQFAIDLGIIVPMVHIKDNLQLEPGEYKLFIKGVEVATGSLMPDYCLAMDPGDVVDTIDGIETIEPAFGLPAYWISENQKEQAQINGYTVVDLSTVIATHITEEIKKHAHELMEDKIYKTLLI